MSTSRCIERIRRIAAIGLISLLAACGGGGEGGNGSSLPSSNVTVGGTVNILSGTGLVLRNNAGDDLPVTASGAFTFASSLANGAAYRVTVATQPTDQNCSVRNSFGTATANISDVEVSCFALQSVVFSRLAGGVQRDLYLVKENGAGPITLADTTDREEFKAIAPNGKIIFTRTVGTNNQDIYSIDAAGTSRVPVVSSTAFETFHAVTPGGRVIYSNAGDLHSVNVDGSGDVGFGTAAGSEDNVLLTPTGKVAFRRIDATKADVYTINVINADGSGEMQLSPANTTDVEIALAVTPAGRVIVQHTSSSTGNPPNDIYSVNEDGTGYVMLAAGGTLNQQFVTVAANERVIYQSLVGTSNSEGLIYSIRADGTGLATLTTDPTHDSYWATIAGGSKIVYAHYVTAGTTTQADIYCINTDGTGAVALASTSANEFFGGETPDGKIVFQRTTDLYLVGADGSGEIRLTNTPESESFVAVAPNGRIIFARTSLTTGGDDLYSVGPQGGDEVALTTTGDVDSAQRAIVTPSSRVIFARSSGVNRDLYSINSDGTDLQTLANAVDQEDVSIVF